MRVDSEQIRGLSVNIKEFIKKLKKKNSKKMYWNFLPPTFIMHHHKC